MLKHKRWREELIKGFSIEPALCTSSRKRNTISESCCTLLHPTPIFVHWIFFCQFSLNSVEICDNYFSFVCLGYFSCCIFWKNQGDDKYVNFSQRNLHHWSEKHFAGDDWMLLVSWYQRSQWLWSRKETTDDNPLKQAKLFRFPWMDATLKSTIIPD